jgi:tetratricopeptide (TPR) repeat protein
MAGEGVAYYRPILIASFVADAQLVGTEAAAFHRTNVVLHAVNAALVVLLLTAYGCNLWAAGIAALLFGLHPIQCQAVALILGRNDELLVAPIVGMLLADELLPRRGWRRLADAVIVLCFAATLWTKETGIVAPIFLLLVDVLWRGRSRRELRSRLPLVIALGVVAVLYFATRVSVLGAVLDTGHYGYTPPLQRIPLAAAIFGYYVRHVFLPWGSAPAPYHPGLVDPTGPDLWIAAAYTAAFVAAAALTLRRAPRVACGLLFFGVALAPVLALAAPMKVLILDHRTYLPMLGIALGVGALTPVAGAGRIGAALALAILATLTTFRLPSYADSLALWKLGVEAAPASDYARNNYAAALMDADQFPEAIAQLREALRLNPDYDRARFNLAGCLEYVGDRPQAMRELELLVERRPDDVAVLNRLGLMRSRAGDFGGAQTLFERAVALHPDDRTLVRNLADLLDRRGAWPAAVVQRRRLTELEPQHGPNWWGLGRALANAGQTAEAIAALERALALGVESGQLHSDLAHALWTVGRWNEAATHVRRARERGVVDAALVQQLTDAGLMDAGG